MDNLNDRMVIFYREILNWIDAGTPAHSIFDARFGLCYNLRTWEYDNFGDKSRLSVDLENEFHSFGMELSYPFYLEPRLDKPEWSYEECRNAERSYSMERSTKSIFKNQRRVHWIRDHAELALTTEQDQ